jgi:hypothetical protein
MAIAAQQCPLSGEQQISVERTVRQAITAGPVHLSARHRVRPVIWRPESRALFPFH